MEWYCIARGTTEGPLSEEAVRAMVGRGDLPPDGLVWREGMDEWRPYSTVFEADKSLPDSTSEGQADEAMRSGTPSRPVRELVIRYRNFRKQPQQYAANAGTLLKRGRQVSFFPSDLSLTVGKHVNPGTGERIHRPTRIALALDRIENRQEVQAVLEAQPTWRERCVLVFHERRATTSPLHRQLLDRYPDWSPEPGVTSGSAPRQVSDRSFGAEPHRTAEKPESAPRRSQSLWSRIKDGLTGRGR